MYSNTNLRRESDRAFPEMSVLSLTSRITTHFEKQRGPPLCYWDAGFRVSIKVTQESFVKQKGVFLSCVVER